MRLVAKKSHIPGRSIDNREISPTRQILIGFACGMPESYAQHRSMLFANILVLFTARHAHATNTHDHHLCVIGQRGLPDAFTPSMPLNKAQAPEDSEDPEKQLTTEPAGPGAGDESGSESDDAEVPADPAAAGSESGPSRPSKKKKKKRSKVARAISALKGDSVPRAVVDQVMAKVVEEHGEDSAVADEDTVREVLKQLKLKDVAEGKAGLFGKNKKDTGDHKVCCSMWRMGTRYRSGIDVARSCSSGRPNLYPTTVRRVHHVCKRCIPILVQTMRPQRKKGILRLLNPEKRSGRVLSNFPRTSNGVFST
jgi:hypothetical protein